MPRIKSLSNLAKDLGSQSSLANVIKVNPVNISVFFSEQQAQDLLTVIPDIKPMRKDSMNEKMKNKLLKTHLLLQSSARQAFKVALSANQIRRDDKCFSVNNSLMIENNDNESIEEGKLTIQKLRDSFKKNQPLVQKLNKALNTTPLRHVTNTKDIGWILDSSQKSQRILETPYTLLINPTIIYGADIETKYEECASFPFIDCMIPRYNRLLIHYYNEEHKSQFLYTSGFLSKVIQHQCQHLEGKTILDWRINHGNISINPSVQQYFPKVTSIIEDYAKSLTEILKKFPQLIQTRSEYIIEPMKLDKLLITIEESLGGNEEAPKLVAKKKQEKNTIKGLNMIENNNTNFTVNKIITNDVLPFEDDYVTRIVKHFKKQFAKFDEKIEMGIIKNSDIKNQTTIAQNYSISTNQQNPSQSYIEEIYSKKIKITYITSNKQKQKQMSNENTIQPGSEEAYDISDQQIDKLLAKKKKGKKRK